MTRSTFQRSGQIAYMANGRTAAAAIRNVLGDEAALVQLVERRPSVPDHGALVLECAFSESIARRFREDHLFSNRIRAALADVYCSCELVTLWTVNVYIRA